MSNGALLIGACVAALSVGVAAVDDAGPPTLTAGTGTIVLASYGKRFVTIDEATEKVTAEIPLQSLAWTMRPSRDGTRFYVQSADQEHFEVVDVATRRTVDTFPLGAPDVHVRALAFDVDPQQRFMVLVTRTARKLIDRFEIGEPAIVQYDLQAHKVIREVPWASDPEPHYYRLLIRFSPDGALFYVFSDKILIYDAHTLTQVDSWDLSLPNESGAGRFNLGSMDETYDDPGFFTALFTTADPIQHRRQLVLGRVDLAHKRLESFPIGPAPDHEDVSFALGGDRQVGYVLLEDIGRYELWTVDLAGRRLQNRVQFKARPRMAIRSSSNGKIIYIFEAGNTIDLYEATRFKYLRTITLEGDMMYSTFHVLPPRPR